MKSQDEPHREIQDKVLDLLGTLSTLYENLSPLLEAVNKEGSVTLDKASIMNFIICVKNAILLTGDTPAQISNHRREQILTKLNPMLTSLAKEEFPDARCQLFGDGFEECLKMRSETADSITKASRAEMPFFFGGASK